MSAAEPDLPILRRLASMPFLDRLELAAVSGTADRSAYAAVSALERRGLAASVIHASDLLRATRRYRLTAAGLRRLAEAEGIAPDELLRAYPVSAQRRRILMERLDGVAVIYRLASSIAAEVGPIEMRWYRAAPLDAAMTLRDGRTLGVVRQGLTSDRTGFSKRLWRLREGPLPGAVFMLMTDEVRLRHARRRSPTRVCRPSSPSSGTRSGQAPRNPSGVCPPSPPPSTSATSSPPTWSGAERSHGSLSR